MRHILLALVCLGSPAVLAGTSVPKAPSAATIQDLAVPELELLKQYWEGGTTTGGWPLQVDEFFGYASSDNWLGKEDTPERFSWSDLQVGEATRERVPVTSVPRQPRELRQTATGRSGV